MGVNPFSVALLLSGIAFVIALLALRRPSGLFTGGRARLPQALRLEPVSRDALPIDARAPVEYLGDRLSSFGFEPLDGPFRLPEFERFGHRLLLLAHHHRDESAVFLMGIEAGLLPTSELMLHVITPLSDGRRVETTTLAPLANVRSPAGVELSVAVDVARLEEMWSRHRRALTHFERRERTEVEDWQELMNRAYVDWLRAGVRAERLFLDTQKLRYRVRV